MDYEGVKKREGLEKNEREKDKGRRRMEKEGVGKWLRRTRRSTKYASSC